MAKRTRAIPTPISNEKVVESNPDDGRTYRTLHLLLSLDDVIRQYGEEQIVHWVDASYTRHKNLGRVTQLVSDPENGQRLVCFSTYEDAVVHHYGLVPFDPATNTDTDFVITERQVGQLCFEISLEVMDQAAEVIRSYMRNLFFSRLKGLIPYRGENL